MPSNGPRSLDRIIRTLRSLMRSTGLPRPDRLLISTRSGTVHADFTTGAAADRLAALLLWVSQLDGLTLSWELHSDHHLVVTANARTGAGLTFDLKAWADVSDFDPQPAGGDVVLAGSFRLVPLVVEPVTFEEVARLVHLGRQVAAHRTRAGVAA